jgi:hypothetical protein
MYSTYNLSCGSYNCKLKEKLKTDLTNVFVQKPRSWKTKKYTIDNLHVRQIFDLGKKK